MGLLLAPQLPQHLLSPDLNVWVGPVQIFCYHSDYDNTNQCVIWGHWGY